MSNDPIYNHLRELSWRRKLTDAEAADMRAWLATHSEAQADWETEARLNAALGQLPDVPVPSNFTARVLQAAQQDVMAELRGREGNWWSWLRQRWLPRTAFAAIVVGAGLVSYHQVQGVYRKKLAESVAVVSAVPSLPSPEILKDFDAIRVLEPKTVPDEQLLAVLQ